MVAAAAHCSTDLLRASVQNSSTHRSGRAHPPQREDWARKRFLAALGDRREERNQPREVVTTGQDHPLGSFHG